MKLRLPYGWTVVLITCLFACLLMGIRFSFGVFFKSFVTEFSLNRAATSGIFSLYLLLSALFAISNGWLFDRYGPRVVFGIMGLFSGLCLLLTSQTTALWQVFLTYSLLFAIGSGGTIPLIAAVVSRWFDKNRGLALSIATGGSGLGSLILPPIAGYLIAASGWRVSALIIGFATLLILLPLSLLLKKNPAGEINELAGNASVPHKQEIAEPARNSTIPDLTLVAALKKKNFWLIFMIWLMYAIWAFTIITHIVPYATDSGVDLVQASTILSISGIVTVAARILSGRAMDIIGIKIPSIILACIGIASILLLVWSHELWMYYIIAAGYGICNGGMGVTILVMPFTTLKSRNIGAIMGTLEVSFTLGAAIGAFLGGFIFDITGAYAIAFFIGCACLLITIPLIYIIREKK